MKKSLMKMFELHEEISFRRLTVEFLLYTGIVHLNVIWNSFWYSSKDDCRVVPDE